MVVIQAAAGGVVVQAQHLDGPVGDQGLASHRAPPSLLP
jgi:hypothetical protein